MNKLDPMPSELHEFYSKALVISVFLAHAGVKDSTRKMSKLRRHIRIALTKDTLKWRDQMVTLSRHVDQSYSQATKAIPTDAHLKVQLSMAMNILYGTLDDNKYQHKWFTNRVFIDAVQSLGYGTGNDEDCKDEEDTYWLVDKFLEIVGYPRESAFAKKIRLAKKIKEQNNILEGK